MDGTPYGEELKFTGEQFIPGRTESRIARDHLARYEFASLHVSGKRVLDIACGVGYGSAMLSDSGAAMVDGVDISADAIDHAARRYGRRNVRFHESEIAAYRSDEPYDVIVCFETIEHVADHGPALMNLSALLHPNGTLLISSPNRLITSPRASSLSDPPRNVFHRREFTIDELLRELRAAGFESQSARVFGQRQQRPIRHRALRYLYTKALQTKRSTSPVVTPVTSLMPRYFIIEAGKAATVAS
jgi:cyclopropane fatty-acyl-phospholipid synthase-like methyltransferase